ncbi:MAG: transporter substrate-binding domain-containing protein [Prevotellaceae bacterium]|jgi:membrane-bound lytic murein transglycosylase F|nr:transporter substrate-binding domain-containing protein [Prevotellaceae bacterium]
MLDRLFFVVICLLLFACKNDEYRRNELDDVERIFQRGELRVITIESAVSYYTSNGDQMGFDYDLAQNFADYLGLPLKVIIATSTEELKQLLLNGEADFAAYRMPHTKENSELFNITDVIFLSQMVLVQPKDNESKIENITQLIDKEVFVKKKSKYYNQLVKVNEYIGGGLEIRFAPDSLNIDKVMYEVSMHNIPLTIADDDVAELGKMYFKNLDISVPVSLPQQKAWIVRKNAPALTDTINAWFSEIEKTRLYKKMKSRYLAKNSYYDNLQIPVSKGSVSPYDKYFKEYAHLTGWDWRLLAAVGWNESHFNFEVVSARGAMGVMQLMPRTAMKFGLNDSTFFLPKNNINAGAKLIASLNRMFSFVKNTEERTKFVLAAYNAGHAHIFDAIALAKKYGTNPQIWEDNVEKYLILKSEHHYYNDDVCKLGYFNAYYTVRFVSDVLRTYKEYSVTGK